MILLDLKRFRSRVGFLRVRTQVIETLQVLETLIINLTGLQTPLHALSSRNSTEVSAVRGVFQKSRQRLHLIHSTQGNR
jgi:hypothetical protein